MRLDISWKLNRNKTFFTIWEHNADSMRTDQDINNSGSDTLVDWATVQRAIDNYRQYITTVTADAGNALSIYPDIDNLYIGNPATQTGVSDVKRETITACWIGAAANLILGSDMTNVDALRRALIANPAV
jgi:alpha-galactosidase